ncbi:MAG TPA: FtsX-like permease family protein [Lacunisphaera sp.]|nr:FtsX-like permease family protein [Lacunisphaera sp.]
MGFILRMAWRDTRASRRRLVLFSLAIVLGVAALVAVGALRDNLRRAIEAQTKTLLGADLTLTSRNPFEGDAAKFAASLGGEQAREIAFNSMLVMPSAGGQTRLVQVRAIEGGFPFYGKFDTEPATAPAALRDGMNAILEESLLVRFNLKPGDRVRLGESEFTVAGGMLAVPGESAAVATLAPRVFIPLASVEKTGLLKAGSLARHRLYFKFAPETDVEKLVRDQRDRLRDLRLGVDTVEERKRQLGNSITNVNSFLSLVGFASLFLGAIGVASAVHAHVRQKVPTVAILRCLGASTRTSFAIYLLQGVGLGILGAVLGAALGLLVQVALPGLLKDFLPFSLDVVISWPAVARGVGAGVVVSVLFALLPLMEVRRVSPLLALRSAFAGENGRRRDWLQLALAALIIATIFAFAIWQTGRLRWGVGFGLAFLLGFAVLAGLARVISWLARRLTPRRLPYAWRQGVANLHRPNNRTLLLLVSLGMGTFLMMTLYLTRDTLLGQLRIVGGNDRPNLMLFDIQDDQIDPLLKLVAANGAPARQHAPIVTMRLASIKGRDVADILKEKDSRIPAWTLRREYRSTYRAQLSDTETVTAGKFTGRIQPGAERVPVSVEEDLARDLKVKLGDELVWDVQGVPVKTYVGSLRHVDWRRLQPNFFIVFPEGVLDGAPKFHVVALRVDSPEQSARVQQAVVQAQPNVSAIDLGIIMQAIDGVYAKATFVVEFLALFTVVTGVIVLAGAVLIGRAQRLRESVLLRTLGATKAQVNRIMLAEYLALGTLGAAVGAVLAVGANWALAFYVFQMKWSQPSVLVLVAGWAAVSAVTVATGLISSRGICDHPPLEVLRQET